MSYRSILIHRAEVQRLDFQDVDGAPAYVWSTIEKDLVCRADTYYQRGFRTSRDLKVPESHQAYGRRGTCFFLAGTDVLPGDRIVVTTKTGLPEGTYEIGGTVQHILDRKGNEHHVEASISEVAQPLVAT